MAMASRRNAAALLHRAVGASTKLFQPRSPAMGMAAAAAETLRPLAVGFQLRCKTTSGSGYSPLKDPQPNWSNRPPKETILLDGCDYEHWLVVMEFSQIPSPTEEEMVAAYVETLANVLGSEEEAKKRIYSVCTTTYSGFGALISEELSFKLKQQPRVLWVLPDSYLDVPNKDYGGDLFIDGKVVHRPQFRFNERPQTGRNRPRPRYDRRKETVQVERKAPVNLNTADLSTDPSQGGSGA